MTNYFNPKDFKLSPEHKDLCGGLKRHIEEIFLESYLRKIRYIDENTGLTMFKPRKLQDIDAMKLFLKQTLSYIFKDKSVQLIMRQIIPQNTNYDMTAPEFLIEIAFPLLFTKEMIKKMKKGEKILYNYRDATKFVEKFSDEFINYISTPQFYLDYYKHP